MNNIFCTIDSREKERIPYAMNFFKKYEPTVKELETGDFIFDNGDEEVCFEYKTIKDFIGSVSDGRIFEQVKRMNDEFDWSFIVIEGTIEDLQRENKRRMLQQNTGRPFSLSQFYGTIARLNCYTTVVQCHNQAQAFNYLEKQMLKIFDDKPLLKHFKNDTDNVVVNFLCCIDGINYKSANVVVYALDLKTLSDLQNLTIDKLLSVDGIGQKKAELIMRVIK